MYRAILAIIYLNLLFATSPTKADDASEFEVYESAGAYYVKSSPDWVPIAGNITFFIPTYDEGDIVKLTNSGNWTSSYVSYSDFVSANAQPSSATINYTDLNSDGVTDIAVTISGDTLYLLADGNETWSLNTAPAISGLANISVTEDTAATRTFVVSDSQESPSELSVSVTSSNTTLIANNQINVTRSGSNYTLTATPTANKSGSSTLTVTADDGLQTTTQTMVVTVSAVNDTPTITNIANQTINEDGTVTVGFTVSDVETSAGSLSLTKQSSNTGLLPTGNIVFGGSGSSRTVKLTPLANKNGTATVTIGVSDGSKSASDSFVLTVNSVNDLPTISGLTPAESNEFGLDEAIVAKASAADIDGNVAQVEFQLNGGAWKADTSSPFSYNFGTLAAGEHTVKARAKDNNGGYSSTLETHFLVSNLAWAEKGGVVPDQVFPALSMNATNYNGPTPGTASVSGGAAVYSVPIALPPGRAGMQPDVSLQYSSKSGYGIAGVGWSLSAGGSVSRCASTLAQDGENVSVTYSTATDKLCLNGQRLMAVSGVYGQAGTEYHFEMDNYTRIFQRSASMNNALSYFEVIHPSGAKTYYGNYNSGDNATVVPVGVDTPLTWLQSRSEDVSGKNHISYTYSNWGTGETTLTKISYTGDGVTDGNRNVQFTYEANAKPKRQYMWGGYTSSTMRLKQIKTYYGSNLITEYSLGYSVSASSGRELLTTLQECGKSPSEMCKEATTFSYSEDAPTVVFEPLDITYNNEKEVAKITPLGDLNGDGVRDWKGRFVNAEGEIVGTTNVELKPCYENRYNKKMSCMAGDFNVDGLTDDWRDNNGKLEIKYTKLNATSSWFSTGITLNDKGVYFTYYEDDHIKNIADYNGDGWPDLMLYRFENYHAPKLWLYLHTQNVNAPYSENNAHLIFTYPVTNNGVESVATHDVQFMGDIDGNGALDLIIADTDSGRYSPDYPQPKPVSIWYNEGDGVTYTSYDFDFTVNAANSITYFSYFFDINADGLVDWLGWREKPGSNTESVMVARLNNGGRTFSDEFTLGGDNLKLLYSIVISGTDGDTEIKTPKYGNAILISDIDGDGVDEILEPGTRVVEGCSKVQAANGTTTKCGDQLYKGYRQSDSTVALIDAQNKDDSIYRWNAYHVVQHANGTFDLVRKETDFYGHAYESVMIDAFGKGLPDMVTLHTLKYSDNTIAAGETASGTPLEGYVGTLGAYISKNKGAATGADAYKPHDMLLSVSSPTGLSASWEYRPLSTGQYTSTNTNRPFYSVDFDYTEQFDVANGEYFHFASSMYAVAEFNIDNGVGGQNTTLYQYKGAVYNNKGRGFMGFREIVEEHTASNTYSLAVFSQTFPTIGSLETFSKFEIGKDQPYEVQTNQWVESSAHTYSNTYRVHNELHTTQKFDINTFTWISTTSTHIGQNDIDAWGNVLKQTVDNSDPHGTHSQTVESEYAATANWPDKLESVVTRASYSATAPLVSGAGGPAIDKTTATYIVSWDNTHRKPKVVTVSEGDTPKQTESDCLSNADGLACSVTVTAYNTYGLTTSTARKGLVTLGNGDASQVQTRTVTTTYSTPGTAAQAAGYFPYEIKTVVGSKTHTAKTKYAPEHGQLIATTNANNITTTTSYDSLFRPVSVTVPGQATRYIRYNTPDSHSVSANVKFMVTHYQQGSPVSKQYIDVLGRTLRSATEGFANGEWTFLDEVFDDLGRRIKVSQPHSGSGTVVYTEYTGFDVLGRIGGKTTPAVQSSESLVTTYEYSGLTTTIDTSAPDGQSLTMSRTSDSAGRLIETVDALGGTTQYAYDAAGSPVVIEDASGNKIIASYDNLGRKLWVDDPNQGETYFTYNDFGELEKEANGSAIQRYDYDALGRVTQRYSSDGNASFVWDTLKLGMLSSETASGITKTYSYDTLARPTAVTTQIDGQSYTVATEYNQTYGFVKSVKYPNNLTLAMHYNSKGYLQYQKNAANDYVYQEITGLDNYGNVNGAKFAENSQIGSYLYSARTGQMLSSKVSVGLNNVHYLAYTDYDSYGNLREQQNLSGNSTQTDTYVYDKLQRLMTSTITVGGQSTNIHYAYDAVGNLLKKTDYSANQNSAYQYASGTNRVMSVQLKGGGTDTFAYDTRGNLTTRNGNVEMAYNVFNKPTAINRLGASVTLAYDANWARYKQQRTVNGNTTTTYYIDKLYEVEVSPTGTKNTSYLGDVAVLVEEGTNKKIRYTHRDRLGSATTFVDHNAKVTAYRFYDPFGKPRMGDGSLMSDFGVSARLANNLLDTDMASRRGFTDHEHLDEVELIHMNGRVYDYNLGRFMSVDPFIQAVGNSQSVNPYSYIMNNPLAGTDPTGYASQTETEDVIEQRAGSRIKRKVGTRATTTVTDDVTGEVTSVTTSTVMNNGNFGVSSTSYSNGNATSVTIVGGNLNSGTSGSATFDIGSQQDKAKSSQPDASDEGRAASLVDHEGNVYGARIRQISAATPEGAWGLIKGVQGIGDEGYEKWVNAGGSSAPEDHPLVMMGSFMGGEVLAGLRIGFSYLPYVGRVDAYLSKHVGRILRQYEKLTGRDRTSFQANLASSLCGIMLACASKFGAPAHLSPYLPKTPPSFNNGINYLHRWYDTTRPYPLRVAEKVE